MASMVVGDLTLESLTPSVNAPLVSWATSSYFRRCYYMTTLWRFGDWHGHRQSLEILGMQDFGTGTPNWGSPNERGN
jgi:hypothetical protein